MNKLKIGFIGVGGIAKVHAGQLQALEDVEIAAIADPNELAVRQFADTFKVRDVRSYRSHIDMLKDGGLDAVVICSPHTLHFAQSTDALSAGCDVLIEKPMTCTSEEAERLIQLADENGRLLQVSYQRHFQPEFIYIREAITSGVLGKLTSVNATLYQDWKVSQTGTWRQNPALSGGGMLMDSGSHIIDVLLWTTGELTPLEVKATLDNHGAPVEIDSFTGIRFAEGVVAALNIVGHVPGYREFYSFCGDQGVLYLDNGRIEIYRYDGTVIRPDLPEKTTNSDQSFVDALRGKQEIPVPGAYALQVVRLTEAIYRSAGYQP
ncbi:Gfo/Idh/MocA family protein [Paenibacillus beijingensis]|uniref:Oxidoreductase n=1 Tax=Paenibacillus beijingensis TaxID=1126833 RepID=A0A0D5NH78_9BACL|nr:Gfo/Idh/MocA family oxidoreductase [Paenibacillus beijingensis]AJY74322.1 oxidoreductase [Paenibacillus beijingensis]